MTAGRGWAFWEGLGENRRFAALMLALTVFYLSFIGWYGFVGPDEPRYARIAEEMMRRGDWVLPTLKGSPWLEKPPLLYWMANVSYRVFGVNEFAARLLSVVLAPAPSRRCTWRCGGRSASGWPSTRRWCWAPACWPSALPAAAPRTCRSPRA